MSNKPTDNGKSTTPLVITAVVLLMRLVIGGTFAFSGFVKAIDPWGTLYKVTDYLLALGWDGMTDYALFIAFALPALELMLGVALICGIYRRSSPIVALLIMVVMLPLTLWLAVSNAVPDCGCFGDAWVLSNWATFWKNVLLTLGIVFLLVYGRKVHGIYGPAVQWMVIAATFAATMGVSLEGYFTQPLIDFRPYKVGIQLVSAQPSASADNYVFIYEKDGERQEFDIDNVPDEEDGWTFVARRENVADSMPALPHSRTFAVTDHGADAADMILDNERVILLLFPDLPEVSIATTFLINELTDIASSHGVEVFGITCATDGQITEWADISMASYAMLVADDTDIKMMARGNPAVVYVKDGIIRWKRALSSISVDRIHDPDRTIDTLGDDLKPSDKLKRIATYYALALLLILLLNRTHLLVMPLFRRKHSQQPSEPIDNN